MNPQNVKKIFDHQSYYLAPAVFKSKQLKNMTDSFNQIASVLSNNEQANNARWSGEQMDALDGGESVVLHTHNIQNYSGVWTQAFMSERFLDITEKILGPDIILHHSKLFLKPPEIGAPFPMHQDWEHFPSQQDKMIAAVIHLTDTDEASGCLRIYPGSHKAGRLDGMKGEGQGSKARPEYPLQGATPVPAKAGDVLFFSYLAVHGSTINTSKVPRKTVLVQLHPGDDRVESGNRHTNLKLALRGRNHFASRHVMGSIR